MGNVQCIRFTRNTLRTAHTNVYTKPRAEIRKTIRKQKANKYISFLWSILFVVQICCCFLFPFASFLFSSIFVNASFSFFRFFFFFFYIHFFHMSNAICSMLILKNSAKMSVCKYIGNEKIFFSHWMAL